MNLIQYKKIMKYDLSAQKIQDTRFKNKKIAVLGFGIEGQSATGYFAAQKAEVAVFDEREEKEFDPELLRSLKKQSVSFNFGPFRGFSGFNYVVRSPGIKLSHPAIQKARSNGARITSATKLFFDVCPCKIIGVTGTKGKGTTSSLIYEMLKAADRDVYLGGNIGTPPLDFISKLTKDSIVVLELSSFQLDDLTKSPHIAVMLMVTSEHLDYHKNTREYVEAKRNILRFQNSSDIAVLNYDYPASRESDIFTDGHVYYVSRETDVEEGVFVRNGKITVKIKNKRLKIKKEQELIDTKDILLVGKHNWENVCAAVMAAIAAGVDTRHIVKVLKTFNGLEHRLELVATISGVKFYDDSFSTTPETAEAAIEAFDAPEILILGGSSKNSDFTRLGKLISEKENIKAIIGIGREWSRIKSKIKNEKLKIIEGCNNTHEIVKAASEMATLGDVVLLSPACASFDMFKNYKERGNQFKKEVLALKTSN